MFSPVAKFVQGHPLLVDYTPSGFTAAGSVVNIGGRLGITHTDIAANALGALSVGLGVYDVVNDGSAFADRQSVFFNASANQCTTSSVGNTFLGWADGAVSSSTAGTATTRVVVPLSSGTLGASTNAIADPGNAGAIPVTASGHVDIVTAGAETRTLAAPTFIGQELLISGTTLAGNAVITAASTINATGNTHITLAANGQAVFLIAKNKNGTPTWSVVSNDGAALS